MCVCTQRSLYFFVTQSLGNCYNGYSSMEEICLRSILRPLVDVEDESISDLFLLQNIPHSIGNKRCRHLRTNPMIAQHHLTTLVDNRT